MKNGCVWDLRALQLNPNTQAKVLLPDIVEIKPLKTDKSDYTATDKALCFYRV